MIDRMRNPELLLQPIAHKISVSLEKAKPFSYRFPKETYHFPTAYSGGVTLENIAFHVKIGIYEGTIFGKVRGKIIIFLDGNPGTEFTETDTTGCYVSLVKGYRPNWRNLRPGEPLPPALTSFVVRPMRDLVTGSHVPYARAVVVSDEDLATMVRFAVIKRLCKEMGAEPSRNAESQDNSPDSIEERYKRKALETGLIREFKRADHQPTGDRTPITAKGKPLSQEIIEERR